MKNAKIDFSRENFPRKFPAKLELKPKADNVERADPVGQDGAGGGLEGEREAWAAAVRGKPWGADNIKPWLIMEETQ